MITREEMQEALNRKGRLSAKAAKTQAKKTIEYASTLIRKGKFNVPNGPIDPEVIDLVQKAFKKEGIDVTVDIIEIPSKSRKKKVYTRKAANYKFSLIGDD